MDFSSLCASRYSVRKFKPEPVREKDLEPILNAGRLSPTAKNIQPQRVLVVRDPASLAALREITPCAFDAPLVLLVCSDVSAAWVNPYDKRDSAEMDASIVATSMMYSAWERGVGSCWVCYFDRDEVRRALAVPERYRIECMLPMGYPAEGSAPAPMHASRLPLEQTVFYERF